MSTHPGMEYHGFEGASPQWPRKPSTRSQGRAFRATTSNDWPRHSGMTERAQPGTRPLVCCIPYYHPSLTLRYYFKLLLIPPSLHYSPSLHTKPKYPAVVSPYPVYNPNKRRSAYCILSKSLLYQVIYCPYSSILRVGAISLVESSVVLPLKFRQERFRGASLAPCTMLHRVI